jgi:tetratricopeptide (TPR) repeat protein
MPGQVYWIGPRCVGRRNEQAYPGTCRFCGHAGKLTAHETRVWFCFLGIPLVPLAHKQILSLCPACQRHLQVDADRWDAARQLSTSGAMERFRANPNPDTAIEAHQQLLAYLDFAQATTFRTRMIQGFSQNARIQAHIGATLAGLGQYEQSAAHFRKALELRPDMPEARIGVAEEHLRAGRLDEARQLLDFMEARDGGLLYSLQPLAGLVIAYQETQQHEKALEILTRVLTDNPSLVDHGPFRALVERFEQALRRPGSILLRAKPKSWLSLLDSSTEAQADPPCSVRVAAWPRPVPQWAAWG